MANPYTWRDPVTNRSSGLERMTHEDMNRITQNLAWLYTQCLEIGITPTGSIISKRDWTQNDIITASFWAELLTCLSNVCDAIQYTPSQVANNQMYYTNINTVETIEFSCYDIISAYERIPNLNHYIGDKWGSAYRYAGDPMNSGGRYE